MILVYTLLFQAAYKRPYRGIQQNTKCNLKKADEETLGKMRSAWKYSLQSAL